MTEVIERIRRSTSAVTPAERRAAEVIVASPETVAFGTVAELAERARVGVATVVRLAGKLGFDGFRDLQEAVQHDLARQLRPAAERIQLDKGEPQSRLDSHLQLELENVQLSLESLGKVQLSDVGRRLARARRVWILSGDASHGIALQVANELSTLRDEIQVVEGNPVAVQRRLSTATEHDAALEIDVRRYDRWVVEAAAVLSARRVWTVALTDQVLSPLAERADSVVIVAAGGGGPFDSHVGTLAVLNVIVAAVAHELRTDAAPRLADTEQAWKQSRALFDG